MAIEARTRTKFHKIGLLLNITKNLGGFMQNVGPQLLAMNQIRGVLKNKIITVIRGTLSRWIQSLWPDAAVTQLTTHSLPG